MLSAHREEWTGQIVAVFEQGEETSYGVIPLLEHLEAQFDGMDGCFALHVYAGAPAGALSVQPGHVMCGAAGFDVVLTGKGGHSSPDLCNNPVDCFVSIYNDLAAVRMRHTDPNDCLTYAVGLLQGGSKSNIIPDSLRFSCLARFFDEETCGRPFLEAAKTIVEKVVLAAQARHAAYNARVKIQRKSPLCGGGLPGKLADCSSRVAEECEIFLVEGDSAGGTAASRPSCPCEAKCSTWKRPWITKCSIQSRLPTYSAHCV